MKTEQEKPGIHQSEIPESLHKYLGSKSPFVVPENYFEDMSGKLNERIAGQADSMQTIKRTAKIRRLNWAAGIAASVALAVIISIYIIPNNHKNGAETSMEIADRNLGRSVLDEYILENTDESEIVEVLVHDPAFSPLMIPIFNADDDTIPEIKLNHDDKAAAQIMADTTLSADDLLEYLSNEGFEPDDE